MPDRYKNIIFDLDGTLIDSAGDIADCLRQALEALPDSGGPCAVEKTCLGMPLKEIVLSVRPELDSREVSSVCARFRELYDSSDYPRTALMPGAAEILARFSGSGRTMFIATNKPLKPALRLLNKFGLAGLFADVAAPDLLPGGKMSKAAMLAYLLSKWNLDKARTVMVGDTGPDVTAARENGIDSAYLLSGYGGEALARSLSPDILLKDLLSLCEVV